MNKSVSYTRWKTIQQPAELAHWVARKGIPPPISEKLAASKVICERFGIDPNDYYDKDVLDIGCGPTRKMAWLAEQGARIYAIDPLLDEYKTHFPESVTTYTSYKAVPAEQRVSEYDGKFALIVCLNVLDHVITPQAVLHNICDYLTSIGTAIISVTCDAPQDDKHICIGTLELLKMCKLANLSIVRAEAGDTHQQSDGTWCAGYRKDDTAVHLWVRRG